MPFFKCTAFFESSQEEGWTEGYYYQGNDHTIALNAFNLMLTLYRLPLMDSRSSLRYLRVSDEAVLKDSKVQSFGGAGIPGGFVSVLPRLIGSERLLIDLEATPVMRFARFLGAIPGEEVTGRNFTPDANYQSAINAWVLQLKAFWLQKHRTNPGKKPAMYSYVNTTDVRIVRMTTRRTGRPFGLVVGRRKRR